MRTTPQTDETDRTKTRARIKGEVIDGEVIDRGFDGEPVVYVEDRDGQTRVIRPERPRHQIDAEPEGQA